ncbi:Alpha/beta hydrolase fold-1 [Mycena metata]|uniref:Alpha/beta hydrolase fold-1 n=1 Tax=Mycena metata TaxID=1033252 RepID=A0AAD7MKN2_9AGAR|nr:Alpha/beta hydrolase fold-1 [Mycena metata]
MLEESVTYPPSGNYPLYLTAKHYWQPAFEANSSDPAALTLLFLHAASFHKETWMPTLEALFALASSKGSPVKIREAWCLDCPNHGASGQLNGTTLLQPEFNNCTFSHERYAQAVYRFLSVGPKEGAPVDFRQRNLVGIGHSQGGVAITILQAIVPSFPFSSLILVEPFLSPAGSNHLHRLRELLVKGAYERRDMWPNREVAMQGLKRRSRTTKWDPRILGIFVVTSLNIAGTYLGVTLACSRDQEAAMYRDPDGTTKPTETLHRYCRAHPVHLILGGIASNSPKRVHEAITDGPFTSVTTMEGVGHLIVQEAPDRLGKAMYDALTMNVRGHSKL